MRILITGATGQVGNEAARRLAQAGLPVRALVRDSSRAVGLDGVELVAGCFEDDASLVRALDGVDALFLAGRDSPDTVSLQCKVLKHAWQGKVRHIVKLSAIGARADSPIALMREHHAMDAALRAGPATWTLVQPHLYMQNLLRFAGSVQGNGRLSAPMADARFPLVDTRDVGAAVAAVLQDAIAHAGKCYRLTGPAACNYGEVAATLSAVIGRPVTYAAVSPEAFEASLLRAGTPAWRAFDLAHIAAAYAPEDAVVSPDVEALLGRPPTALEEFLLDHRAVFAGGG
jgi:uncharacterized protein YbjT (DUF2867 family)